MKEEGGRRSLALFHSIAPHFNSNAPTLNPPRATNYYS
jgi:hypothetical protein